MNTRWTKATAFASGLKYPTNRQWELNECGAYRFISNKHPELLALINEHRVQSGVSKKQVYRPTPAKRSWTYAKVLEAARQSRSKTQFILENMGAYCYSLRHPELKPKIDRIILQNRLKALEQLL